MIRRVVEALRWETTYCRICHQPQFQAKRGSGLDPQLAQLSGGGVEGGSLPLAVCQGSWRSLWRRTWYHQACCGVYDDALDRSGRWYVFGFTPVDQRGPERKSDAEVMKPAPRCWIFWHPWKSGVPFGHCQRCNRPPLSCCLFGHDLSGRNGSEASWYCTRCGVLDPTVDIFDSDYEATKLVRERSERLARLTPLAREFVDRTLTGEWEGWERRVDKWLQLTNGMNEAVVEYFILEACRDDKTRAEYLAIRRSNE